MSRSPTHWTPAAVVLLLTLAGSPVRAANGDMGMVCPATNLGWQNFTLFANNDVPSDVPLADDTTFASAPLVLYGMASPYEGLAFTIGSAGLGPGTMLWKYWDGARWAPLPVTDGTNHFHQSGTVSFASPADWAALSVAGCPGSFYYVKTLTDHPFTAQPLASRVSAVL